MLRPMLSIRTSDRLSAGAALAGLLLFAGCAPKGGGVQYDAYTDATVASPFRPNLRQIAAVTTRDSLTVVFRFRQRYPEMFYDAVYHMRVLPSHLLRELPRDQWHSAAFGRAPVGDGPYRFVAWKAGESLQLA